MSDKEAPSRREPHVAFVVSRFPKITETFILYEILAMERLGLSVELFALRRERQAVVHPEAVAMTRRTHFHAFVSLDVLRANWHFLSRRPRAYLRTVTEALGGTVGSPKLFIGAVAFLPMAVFFAERMERSGVTHVHAHFATHPALVALIVHRLTGIPYSFTAHGSDLHVDRRMLDVKLEAAKFAVTCSEFNRRVMAQSAADQLSASKLHVIKYGVDLDLFYPPADERSHQVTEIICVASLEDVKGHKFLIEACRLLAESGVAFRLQLVGDGPQRSDLERRVAAAGLEQFTVFHGMRNRAAVADMLRAADIKVLASYPAPDGKREGMPNVLIEAMASGLPVVSTQLTGIPELVESGTTGYLVPPADPAALADALRALCLDPSLRLRMGSAGRRKAQQEFDRTTNALALARLVGLPR
jgi:colanic acid/amylovoran biosynthesis glycosyltransferase